MITPRRIQLFGVLWIGLALQGCATEISPDAYTPSAHDPQAVPFGVDDPNHYNSLTGKKDSF